MVDRRAESHPITSLDGADLEFITRLVLASGSLKELAASYGVSYPTIRTRLDRVIERLQAALSARQRDPVSDLLADLVDRGEMTVGAARAVRSLLRSLDEQATRQEGDAP